MNTEDRNIQIEQGAIAARYNRKATWIISLLGLVYAVMESGLLVYVEPMAPSLSFVRSWDKIMPSGMIQFALNALFWIPFFNLAARSRICSFLALPIAIEYIVYHYEQVHFGTFYRIVVEAAYGTTIEQVSTYLTFKNVFLICLATVAIVTYAVWGYRLLWKYQAPSVKKPLLWFGLSVIIPFFLLNGHWLGLPDCYYMLCCKKDGMEVTEENCNNPDNRRHWEDCMSGECFLPYWRWQLWCVTGYKCYFPEPVQDCAQQGSELFLEDSQDDVCVVLYVAESFRQDHSPFAGYHRNTLPLVSGRYAHNVINLPNMISYDTHTFACVYGILTDAEDTRRVPVYNSFLSLFRKHGYECFYIDHDSDGAPCYNVLKIRRLFENTAQVYMGSKSAAGLAARLDSCLTKPSRQMFFIEDGSGHWPYAAASGKIWGDDIVARYDEARLQTDKNLYEVIRRLEERPAIVLFVSDHAESLGEEGRTCHGGPLYCMEQRKPAAFIWYSKKYEEQFPEVIRNLRENAEAFTSQDFIFHTMPGMGGIHSSVQKDDMNMTLPQDKK